MLKLFTGLGNDSDFKTTIKYNSLDLKVKLSYIKSKGLFLRNFAV